MKIFILSAVLAACTVSSLSTAVASDGSFSFKRSSDACCPCQGPGYCADATPCTPDCGYGPCNIFACACRGGCRVSRKSSRSDNQSLHLKRSSPNDNGSSEYFDIADTDKDGKITFDEWRNSPVRSTFSGETDSMLAERWAKFDTGKAGYLTKDEAINRKA